MSKDLLTLKIILFDIDTNKLESRLGPSYKNAYARITKFFCSRGFKHIQGSGYESTVCITQLEAVYLYKQLLQTFPYLDGCMRDVRCANVIEFHDFSDIHADTDIDSLDFSVPKDIKTHFIDDYEIEL